MKFNKIFSTLGLLTASLVSASRSDFYGSEDNRPKLFQILDDHVGTIKVNLESEVWENMKKKSVLEPWNAGEVGEKYGSENATLEFYVDGTDYRVELKPGQFSFKLGGKITRNFAKPGYNLKIENGDLFEVKSLRLRSGYRDNSLMREKLSSDMFYKMGVPTTSTNYIRVEVNGENLGLYIATNKIKKDFIKRYYGEKNTNNLYECRIDRTRFEDFSVAEKCDNTKEELVDKRDDIRKFNEAINNAKSIDDIKDIIDVETFLKTICFEFLTLAWDHFLVYNHNYFWYKKPDGKWTIILNDFDETWAQDLWTTIYRGEGLSEEQTYVDKSYIPDADGLPWANFPNFSIRDCDMGHKIIKLLIYDNEEQWREIVGEVVKNYFNPTILFKRIEEIKELIYDDVVINRTINPETGKFIGCFNTEGFDPKWNMTHFEEGINYVNWANNPDQARSYGLKFFIEERFKYICHTYGINPETLELIQPRPAVAFWGIVNKYSFYWGEGELFNDEFITWSFPDLDKEDYKQESYNADPIKNAKPSNYVIPLTIHEMAEAEENPKDNGSDNATTTTAVAEPTSTVEDSACWSEKLGYPCCVSSCYVYESDNEGEWGYEDNHWCGISSSCSNDVCWSKKFGYDCCNGCTSYEEDSNGKWGYEENKWCGIVSENCN